MGEKAGEFMTDRDLNQVPAAATPMDSDTPNAGVDSGI